MAPLLILGAAAGVATAVTGSLVFGLVVGTGAAIALSGSEVEGWVHDNVVSPVARTAERIVKEVFDNPIEAIAKIAAVATGNAWAIPLVDGASTLARTGNVGDALKATAVSYVAGKVGGTVGKVVTSEVAKATGSELAATIVGGGTAKAATAIVMGRDPVSAFISGGVNAGLSASAGWINSATNGAFANLPPAAQNIITSTINASVSTAAAGGRITSAVVWDAVLSSRAVTDVVSDFIGTRTNLSDAQVGALTTAVTRTVAAGFSGGDIPAALRSALDSYGTSEFKKWFDRTTPGTTLNNTLDKITGDYQRAETAARKLEGTRNSYDAKYTAYSGTVTEINNGVAEEQRLKTLYERALSNFKANENQANADAVSQAVTAYNDYVTAFNTRYTNTLKPALDRYEKDLAALETQFNKDLTAYEKTITTLETASDRLNSDLTPLYTEIDKTFVKFMDPSFNEAEYRQIAGLKSSDDAYLHWLREGKNQGLPTNMKAYAAEVDDWQRRVLNGAFARAGIDPGDLTPAQLKSFTDTVNSQYNTLQKLKTAPIATLGDSIKKTYTDNQTAVQADKNTLFRIIDVLEDYDDAARLGTSAVITKEVNDVLKLVGRPAGIIGEELTKADYDALDKKLGDVSRSVTARTVTVSDIANAGATSAEIAAGVATRTIDPDTGLLNWNTMGVAKPIYSPELGMVVFQYTVPNYTKVDKSTNVSGWPAGVHMPADGATPTGSYSYVYKDLKGNWVTGVRSTPLTGFESTPVGKTIYDLRTSAPGQFIEQVAGLSADGAKVVANVVGDAVVEFSKNAVTYAKTLDAVKSDEFLNTAGIALEAGGELLDTFNTAISLSLGIDPSSTPAGRVAQDLLTLGNNTKTPEWRAAVDRMNAVMAQGEGWGKIGAVFGAIREAPIQFTAEIIGKEILQEIPVLLASGGTGTATKLLLRTAGEDVAKKMGVRAALGTAAVLDLTESFGGAASSAYDSAYATAINSGMSAAQAETYARDLAISAGMIGAATTLASLGKLDGNAFERVILGGNGSSSVAEGFDWLRRKVAEGADVTWREGVQESIEEGLPTLFTETILTQIDPGRDVLGSVAQAALLGSIAGAGTAGGIYTGHAVADALLRTNAEVRNAVQNGKANPAAADNALRSLGVTDDVVRRNILSSVSDQYTSTGKVKQTFDKHPYFSATDADILTAVLNSTDKGLVSYVDTYVDQRYLDIAEVKAAAAAEGVTLTDAEAAVYVGQKDEAQTIYTLRQEIDPRATSRDEAAAFFAERGYTPSATELTQFTGPRPETTVKSEIGTYVNPRQVTEAEARKFFADRGYTPTEAEVRQFVGQGAADFEATAPGRVQTYVNPRQVTEAEARKFFTDRGYTPTETEIRQFVGQGGATFESTTNTGVGTYVNPRQVTEAEARKFFADRGYTPTDAEVRQFVGQGGTTFESTTGTGVGTYVNPRQVTEAEARKFFADRGYTPTDAEVRQFVGQGGADFEATAPGRVQTYVEPRQVTEADARKFFADIGYTPTDAEVRQFVGQGGADFRATAIGRVSEYADPRYVTEDEVRAAYETLGLARPTQDDLARFVGQYDESELAGRAEEYLPTARYNSIVEQIETLAAQSGGGPEVQAAIDAVKADLQGQLTQLGYRFDEVTGELRDTIAASEDRLIAQIRANEADGMARDAAIQKAVSDIAAELGTTTTTLLSRLGETTQSLNTRVDALAADIDATRAAILDRMQELESSGATRDEALQAAIDEVAGDVGTTRDELLAQLGETEQTFLDRLGEVETGLQEQLGDVELSIMYRMHELEAAGVARDEALQTAIDEVAGDVGTTREELLTQLGETEQSLIDRLTDAEARLTAGLTNAVTALVEQAAAYEAAGIARDEALSQAIDDVAGDLGTTREELLTQLGQTEQSLLDELGVTREDLLTQLGQTETTLRSDMQAIADLIGKPVGEVTDVDIDFVADILAQEEALTTFTPEQLLYDVTGDQQITQADLDLLTQIQQGTPVQISPESKFAPTGLYADIYRSSVQQALDTQAALAAEEETRRQQELQYEQQLETQRQIEQNLQTQIQTSRQQANIGALWNLLAQQQDLYGQRVDVTTPDPLQLRYIYDFSSIFATPQQSSMFPSPYAKGGQVEAVNDTLLELLRGS